MNDKRREWGSGLGPARRRREGRKGGEEGRGVFSKPAFSMKNAGGRRRRRKRTESEET